MTDIYIQGLIKIKTKYNAKNKSVSKTYYMCTVKNTMYFISQIFKTYKW